jgi:SAM-dependent methyltransferase
MLKNPQRYLCSRDDLESYNAFHGRSTLSITDAFLSLVDLLKDKESINVLVIGPGDGKFDLFPLIEAFKDRTSNAQVSIVAVEQSSLMCDVLKSTIYSNNGFRSLQVINCEIDAYIREMCVSSSKPRLDVIVAFSVLHHLPNWRDSLLFLTEYLLVPDGLFLFDEWKGNNPIYHFDFNTSIAADQQLRYLFALREASIGIFWDPEIRGHDMGSVAEWLLRLQFVCKGCIERHQTETKINLPIAETFFGARNLAITRWGAGRVFEDWVSRQNTSIVSQEIVGSVANYAVHLFSRKKENGPSPFFNIGGVADKYYAKLYAHLTAELKPMAGIANHAEIRFVQALQFFLQYGMATFDTVWCLPIRARIDKSTLEIQPATEPITTFIFRDTDNNYEAISYMLLNMYRLLEVVKIPSQSITTEILQMLEQGSCDKSWRESVIEVSLAEANEKKSCDVVDQFGVVGMSIPQQHLFDANAVGAVKQAFDGWLQSNMDYRFGEFVLVNLRNAYSSVLPTIRKMDLDSSPPRKQLKDVKSVIEQFGPMLRDGDVLKIVLSPYKATINADKQDIDQKVIGGFLMLERKRGLKSQRELDRMRYSRIQFLNRLLQSDVTGYLHDRALEERSVLLERDAKAQIHEDIKDDLGKLLKYSQEIQHYATRITVTMSTSRHSLWSSLKGFEILFVPQKIVYWSADDTIIFLDNPDDGVHVNQLLTIHDLTNFKPYGSFVQACNSYLKFVRHVSKHFKIPLFSDIGDVSSEDHAFVVLSLLKIVFHRTFTSNARVYDIQLVLAILLSVNANIEAKTPLINWMHGHGCIHSDTVATGVEPSVGILGMLKTFQGATFIDSSLPLLSDREDAAAILVSDIPVFDLLAAIGSLCEQLACGNRYGVSLSECNVVSRSNSVCLLLECDGSIDRKALLSGSDSAFHDFRSCVLTICRSCGLGEPIEYEQWWNSDNNLENSNLRQFGFFATNNKTQFVFLIPRKRSSLIVRKPVIDEVAEFNC